MKHSLERTSPKGKDKKFIGVCVLCGEPGLPIEAANLECPNLRGLTSDEAVVEAILSPDLVAMGNNRVGKA